MNRKKSTISIVKSRGKIDIIEITKSYITNFTKKNYTYKILISVYI